MIDRAVTFLLVEDDDNHAHLVMRSLARSPVTNQVYRVHNGEEALAFLRGAGVYARYPRPDVVLLDLNLPRLSGHEVLRDIKEDRDLQAIPVVVLTTSCAERDRERAYSFHANSYVVKPVDFDQFQQLVTDLCQYWGAWNQPPVRNESV
jgi:CheY-like chemotaxis protein